MTAPDGKVTEWWLNPPRLLNGRYFDHFVPTTAFPSMRPDFVDAKTIQPVALGKDVSKQFILTAHVTSGIPAGLYRGEVKIKGEGEDGGEGEEWKIPVELKVLDFDLPKPMAYLHPEKDFRICSYDYFGLNEILSLNGGDRELLGKRVKAIQVKNWKGEDCGGGLHGFGDSLNAGDVDFAKAFAALEKIGYAGTFTAEMIPFSRLPDLVLPDQALAEKTVEELNRI